MGADVQPCHLLIRTSNRPLGDLMLESFGRDAKLWYAEFENITATEAGMELPDAALKIGAAGKWQHFQKDFFYRLVRHLN
ncbi:MAG: hypothetical protein KAV69_05545 [Deltaproteobacteria bacterium]|nr:hypothetical protein [Deltaproteobacteria bacterium]